MIDASPLHLQTIKNILKKHIPDYEVRAFGSRVKKSAKKYSDLDLVIKGKTKAPKKTLYLLKEDFQESDLPFRVEIIDWHSISEDFKKIIQAQYEVLQPA